MRTIRKETYDIPLKLYFNLSGGMNNLILASYTASMYLPTTMVFTHIENTNLITKFIPNNSMIRLKKKHKQILIIIMREIELKLDEVVRYKLDQGDLEDRSTIFRHLQMLEKLNLIKGDYKGSKRKVTYKITSQGKYLVKSMELFPIFYED